MSSVASVRLTYAHVTRADDHLGRDPTQESRSRIKRMGQPVWSQYRLRVGEFRVYQDVDEAARVVSILRVLPKGTRTGPERQP
jgi:mRNA-degrading endonuclease RelE of RelBE toxin-antitoxin system